MKIAVLMPYPPAYKDQIPVLPGNAAQGGGETSSFANALEFAKQGHSVTYYTGRYKGISCSELEVNSNLRVVYLQSLLKNMGLAAPVKLFFELLLNDYDVIHSQQIPIMYSLIGAVTSKIKGKRFIMTFHGRMPYCFIDRWIGKVSSYFAHVVTVQSEFSYNLVRSYVSQEKLVTIPNGVDTNRFTKRKLNKDFIEKYKRENEKIILFVGRLIPAKGIDVLIEACKLLELNYKLLIVGEGTLKEELKLHAEKLGISKRVIFLGSVSQESLPLYYSLADVFVLPSTSTDSLGRKIPNVSENFGNVLAEAMACELPVIASRIGGVPDWISDNENGLLFKERDVNDLSIKLSNILTDKVLREKIIAKAHHSIKSKYSWEAIVRKFEMYF